LAGIALLCEISNAAVEFPGTAPGKAEATQEADRIHLRNAVLDASWKILDGRAAWEGFTSQLNQTQLTNVASLFVLETSAGRMDSANCVLESKPLVQTLVPDSKARRNADHLAGKSITATFRHAETGVKVAWQAELRDGANALRSSIQITAGASRLTVNKITLMDGILTNAAVIGSVQSSPVAGNGIFLGYEHPLAWNSVEKWKSRLRP
jgi:hypothetical protein